MRHCCFDQVHSSPPPASCCPSSTVGLIRLCSVCFLNACVFKCQNTKEQKRLLIKLVQYRLIMIKLNKILVLSLFQHWYITLFVSSSFKKQITINSQILCYYVFSPLLFWSITDQSALLTFFCVRGLVSRHGRHFELWMNYWEWSWISRHVWGVSVYFSCLASVYFSCLASLSANIMELLFAVVMLLSIICSTDIKI